MDKLQKFLEALRELNEQHIQKLPREITLPSECRSREIDKLVELGVTVRFYPTVTRELKRYLKHQITYDNLGKGE